MIATPYPDAKIAVTVSEAVSLDTLKRCLAYGGHDAYRHSRRDAGGFEVESRTVLFTSLAGFSQFKLAFEDQFVAMDFEPDAFDETTRQTLHDYKETFR